MVEQRFTRSKTGRVSGHLLVLLKHGPVVDPIPERVPFPLVDHGNVLATAEAPSNLHRDEPARLL
jgi:hypothetical protein